LVRHPESWPRSGVKTGSVGLLAVAAVMMVSPVSLVVALAAGALGDLLLSRPGDRAFLAGVAAFAVSHIALIWLMITHGGAVLWPLPWGAILIVALAVGMGVILWRYAGRLRVPVLIYVAIIATMGCVALTLAPSAALGRLAAGLFILSDTVLALELFVVARIPPVRPAMALIVWSFFWSAQFLFLLTFSLLWIT